MRESKADRPKIGLALSGGSGRAIAHVGVLEVLQEHKIPLDIITACSSGTIVAGSFACGTMEGLKKEWLQLDKKFFFELLELDYGDKGIFATNKFAAWFGKFLTKKNFDEVWPRLGFVCVDLVSGEPLVLAMGDMVRAGKASCAVPGLFEPVEWGNRLLVDGGLFSLVPVEHARQLGAEIVIGVDIAASRFMYEKSFVNAWRGYSYFRNSVPFRLVGKIFNFASRLYENSLKLIFYSQSDFLDDDLLKQNHDWLTIFQRAMDLAQEQHRKDSGPTPDLMLSPKVKHFGKIDFKNAKQMYYEGRRVALEAIPQIQKLISNYRAS